MLLRGNATVRKDWGERRSVLERSVQYFWITCITYGVDRLVIERLLLKNHSKPNGMDDAKHEKLDDTLAYAMKARSRQEQPAQPLVSPWSRGSAVRQN